MTREHPKPILVVDDDVPTQMLYKALLSRLGHNVVVAVNGAEAIDLLRAGDYALIILDLMMPDVSGLDVIALLRDSRRDIPVLVCTAAGPLVTATLGHDIVKGVIRKPFEIDQLTSTVGALIAFAPPPSSRRRILIVDDDPGARYIIRAFLDETEVSEADTGEQALDLIRQSRPDAVFLDLVLPGSSGEEVLRRLHETVETSDLPVIIVTSHKLDDTARAALLEHASAVIYKGDLSREKMREVMDGIRGN